MTLKELPQSEYKMKLKLSSRRFAQALSGGNLTPQDEGIILHGIMERARGVDDIIRSIEQLVIDGILSQAAAQEVASQVESVLQNEIVRSWFSDNWQSVRNECEIIVPKADYSTDVVTNYRMNAQIRHRRTIQKARIRRWRMDAIEE